jgi:chromosome segregation ATPase
MKKLFRPIAAFFSAALLLTSCIDNTVSDQVNKIREAQVNLLNAQTRLQEADAAYKEAQAAGLEIANAKEESNLEKLIAQNATLIAQEEAKLAKAVEDLRVYLLTQGAVTADSLLNKYQQFMGEAFDVATGIAEDRAKLARWNLLFTDAIDEEVAEDATTFALMEEKLERELAAEEAKLAAQENALELLEAVAGGTADAVEELAELEAANQDLTNKHAALNIEAAKVSNAIDALTSEVDNDEDGFSDGTIPHFEEAEEAVEDATAALASAQAAAAQDLATAAAAQTNYDNAKQLFDNYTTQLVAKFTAFNSALSTAKTRFQAVKDKAAELEILQAMKDAGGNVTDAQITAAKTAVTNAITTYEGSVGDTGMDGDAYDLGVLGSYCGGTTPGDQPGAYIADSGLDKANKDYNPIRDYFDGGTAYDLINQIGEYNENTFLTQFENGGGSIANITKVEEPDGLLGTLIQAKADAAEEQDNIDEAQADLDEAEALVAELQTAYDEAVADLPGLKEDQAEITDTQAGYAAQITENDDVIDALKGFLGLGEAPTEVAAEANKAIEDKKDEIEDTKDAIAQIQKALANNSIDLQKVQDYIAALEADIEEQEGELAAIQAIAAEYLELLNAELD